MTLTRINGSKTGGYKCWKHIDRVAIHEVSLPLIIVLDLNFHSSKPYSKIKLSNS